MSSDGLTPLRRLTPFLIVTQIDTCLDFRIGRLDFAVTNEFAAADGALVFQASAVDSQSKRLKHEGHEDHEDHEGKAVEFFPFVSFVSFVVKALAVASKKRKTDTPRMSASAGCAQFD